MKSKNMKLLFKKIDNLSFMLLITFIKTSSN